MKSAIVSLTCCIGLIVEAIQPQAADFESVIKPLLESRCLSCHNPNNAKGDLSLATAQEAIAYDPEIFSVSEPETSLLLSVVTPQNGEAPEMPKKGEALTVQERESLRQWIAAGADWPASITLREASEATLQWWAYQPLQPMAEAPFSHIDSFIESRLNSQSLSRNPPADRRTLIRRASYDLTGLPPRPQEVEAFVQNPDPKAYEQLLDRLLASPRYGERWGRHWLDVVRFGESNGYERNVIINNLWPFRDYVIESINADKPFDRFIREHLAGDVIGAGQPEIEIGSAFLVAGPYDDVGNQDAIQAAQIRANTLDEIIRTTTEAFLGMTVGCARCHDHKFDPIKQADYYQLYATFAGVKHGSETWATPEEKASRNERLQPLNQKRTELERSLQSLDEDILQRARAKLDEHEATWVRPKIARTGIEDTFGPLTTKFVRLISEGQDSNPNNKKNFNIDEFEIWSADVTPKNVALASNGSRASGESRRIEDFADAYNAELAIDGQFGARFIATGGSLTIELPKPTRINRIFFSSARGESVPTQGKFTFLGEYRIEGSIDGNTWKRIADSHDRIPVNEAFRDYRLRQLETTQEDREQRKQLREQLAQINREIQVVPKLKTAFLGTRSHPDAQGPFHLFQGGSPQRRGEPVVPASLSTLQEVTPAFTLSPDAPESKRRERLAKWVTHPQNPLAARVLANRVWHYHFGAGIVDTPSDFGVMGGRPSHPQLLDFLANKLIQGGWRLKSLHKLIMLSQTYQQSSAWISEAAKRDGASRLLWRFPPRRLSAEEIRDTILFVSGQLDFSAGGPGFRLYKFMQDNVSTYDPLDTHGPDTYRRAVYHQNVRASVVDLMTDFDLPDCAFSTPRRARTTTPLQALTLLNHSFTIDMANAFAGRIESHTLFSQPIQAAYQVAYQRPPDAEEFNRAKALVAKHGLRAFCRALLNSNELIYLD